VMNFWLELKGDDYRPWMEWIRLEIELSNVEEARQIYRNGCDRLLGKWAVEKLCHDWLRFEREFGSLHDYDAAARRCEKQFLQLAAARSASTAPTTPQQQSGHQQQSISQSDRSNKRKHPAEPTPSPKQKDKKRKKKDLNKAEISVNQQDQEASKKTASTAAIIEPPMMTVPQQLASTEPVGSHSSTTSASASASVTIPSPPRPSQAHLRKRDLRKLEREAGKAEKREQDEMRAKKKIPFQSQPLRHPTERLQLVPRHLQTNRPTAEKSAAQPLPASALDSAVSSTPVAGPDSKQLSNADFRSMLLNKAK